MRACMKKRKNIILLTLCMVICFILYQLYFFVTITSETTNGNIIPIIEHKSFDEVIHVRSKADKFINHNGVIKGVLEKHMVKYRPGANNEFKCLNSEQYIPFERMNDDYCDCEDGTDEPSTAACPNGIFYCDTQYTKQRSSLLTVPSNRVNDGICDCCDGSDEWILTPNTKLLSQSQNHYRHYVTLCSNNCY